MLECRVLFFGDIVGRIGRQYLQSQWSSLMEQYRPDFVFANAENATNGFGLTAATAHELKTFGLHGLTLGNHTWDQKSLWGEMDGLPFVCRPANFSSVCPGRTHLVFDFQGERLAVINLLGRAGMKTLFDCPFKTAEALIQALREHGIHNFMVDFHAEMTAEKYALGWFLSRRGVSAVVGTHTHVQTADARLLNQKTAFMCDLGMCGPVESVLGVDIETIIAHVVDGKPGRFEVAKGPAMLNGALIRLDLEQHVALSIERVFRSEVPFIP